MKFQKGDLVWLGWVPDSLFDGPMEERERDKNYRMRQGEILNYMGISWVNGTGFCNMWLVKLDSKELVASAEPYLIKIPPEEHGRTEKEKDREPAEAV